jgi:D-alanyl-D-alanine carboxypeptidase
VASASRGAHQLITVLLNDTHRWTDAEALLEYGFAALGGQVPRLKAFGIGSGDIQKGEGG